MIPLDVRDVVCVQDVIDARQDVVVRVGVREVKHLLLPGCGGKPARGLNNPLGMVAGKIRIRVHRGKVSDDGTVLRAPFLQWRNVPLGRLVQERTGMPVAVENDVVALTVGEQWFGAGRGISSFAVLTIGAGVGYGLVIDDRVIAPVDTGLGP